MTYNNSREAFQSLLPQVEGEASAAVGGIETGEAWGSVPDLHESSFSSIVPTVLTLPHADLDPSLHAWLCPSGHVLRPSAAESRPLPAPFGGVLGASSTLDGQYAMVAEVQGMQATCGAPL